MADRIYYVTDASGGHRLIRAISPAQALKYVMGKQFTVEPASSVVVAELMGSGTFVEDATVKQKTKA
jgi:hypothetical protein